jgi:hypothetical protein
MHAAPRISPLFDALLRRKGYEKIVFDSPQSICYIPFLDKQASKPHEY